MKSKPITFRVDEELHKRGVKIFKEKSINKSAFLSAAYREMVNKLEGER